MGSDVPLPLAVGELTASWFSDILDQEVTGVTVKQEVYGTAAKVFVKLTYADAVGAPPERLCVKGGFNLELTQLHPDLFASYRLEAAFYSQIASFVAMHLPQVYYCGTDTVNGQGIVVMEDLTTSGCSFSNVTEQSWSMDLVRSSIHELARLHARTWARASAVYCAAEKQQQLPWVKTSSSRAQIERRLCRRERSSGTTTPEELRDGSRVVAAFRTLWRTADPRLQVLVHGDSHVGNTFLSASGRPGFIDWQGMRPDSALHDVAYFLTSALSIEDRRTHEKKLLQSYLDALAEAGGPRFVVEDVWDEFRRQQLHGILWTAPSPQEQSDPTIEIYSARYVAAIMDHKTLELIESHPEHKSFEASSERDLSFTRMFHRPTLHV
jgi:hypothetical protein